MTTETFFDEAAAVAAARDGDRAAFGELVRRYQRAAYSLAYGFVGNREDALDMAQEAFARAYRAMDRFQHGRPFYPWLYQIIRNTCFNHLKRRRRRGEISLDGLTETGFDAPDYDTPCRAAALNDVQRGVVRGLETLTDEHREIIVLRHIHDLSYSEIAACLEIPTGTVMSRLHAARRNLQAALRAEGLDPKRARAEGLDPARARAEQPGSEVVS